IGLNSLVDGEPGERPAYPIPTIIKCAILGSPHQQLTLSELYAAMEARFSYYRDSDKKSWRNSVRHNLSLNNQFDKKARPITEPGKGHYWVVVPDMPQGNKRERKR
ncbi:winged helix DNA-binding domain-containing protein, partial [Ramaria rubella]